MMREVARGCKKRDAVRSSGKGRVAQEDEDEWCNGKQGNGGKCMIMEHFKSACGHSMLIARLSIYVY